jgi:hypothetical protein
MEFISLNPKPLKVISFVPLYMFLWRFIIDVSDRQQQPRTLGQELAWGRVPAEVPCIFYFLQFIFRHLSTY